MKKSTLNAIMYGVIIFLCIGIGIFSIKLVARNNSAPEPEEESEVEVVSEEPESEEEKIEVVDRVRITSDNINVRTQPNTESERLGSAYSSYTYEYVSKTDDGWVKIIYDGKEAYVFGEYVEIVPMYYNENAEEWIVYKDDSSNAQ